MTALTLRDRAMTEPTRGEGEPPPPQAPESRAAPPEASPMTDLPVHSRVEEDYLDWQENLGRTRGDLWRADAALLAGLLLMVTAIVTIAILAWLR